MPDPRDPRLTIERETLKLVVQHPLLTGLATKDVGPDDFTHPAYRAVWETVARSGGPSAAGAQWASDLRAAADDPTVQALLSAVAVEPLLTGKEPDQPYAATHVFRLQELTALRRIADLKSRLQRTNPVEHATEYNRMFGELVALEQHRRNLRELAVGGS
jgi:DNA primase